MTKSKMVKSGTFVQMGRFIVTSQIAKGAMGSVFKAIDKRTGNVVALKLLMSSSLPKQIAEERFRREAVYAARLNHPNIVRVYESGKIGEKLYIAMEYVEGEDLQRRIDREGALSPKVARNLLQQLAAGLHHAAKHGVVHRDVKPSNILVMETGSELEVKLADFGLACVGEEMESRLTREGNTVGTIDYMSPEQAMNSSQVDIRSDLYSLGCSLYHMLAGVAPFSTGSIAERVCKHMSAPPPDFRNLISGVPDELWQVLMKLLAKKPEDRYQTPQELLDDLAATPAVKRDGCTWDRADGSDSRNIADTQRSLKTTYNLALKFDVPRIDSEIRKALQYQQTGHFDLARNTLLRACRENPGNVNCRRLLRLLPVPAAPPDLPTHIRTWLAEHLLPALRFRASCFLGRFHDLLYFGEVVLLHCPKAITTQIKMAEAAARLDLVELAEWLLKNALQQAPRNINAHRALAYLYEKGSNLKKAAQHWETILRLDRDHGEAHRRLITLSALHTIKQYTKDA